MPHRLHIAPCLKTARILWATLLCGQAPDPPHTPLYPKQADCSLPWSEEPGAKPQHCNTRHTVHTQLQQPPRHPCGRAAADPSSPQHMCTPCDSHNRCCAGSINMHACNHEGVSHPTDAQHAVHPQHSRGPHSLPLMIQDCTAGLPATPSGTLPVTQCTHMRPSSLAAGPTPTSPTLCLSAYLLLGVGLSGPPLCFLAAASPRGRCPTSACACSRLAMQEGRPTRPHQPGLTP